MANIKKIKLGNTIYDIEDSTARSTANSANTTAQAAQTTANSANTTAQAAQTTANSANTTAQAAQAAVNGKVSASYESSTSSLILS